MERGGGRRQIVIVAPGGAATGGVELLHQLCDVLVRAGLRAQIVYYPFDRPHDRRGDYGAYECEAIERAAVEPDAIVVLPEVYTYLARAFGTAKVLLWWLSVDNYLGSRRLRYALGNRFRPWDFLDIRTRGGQGQVGGHLTQSEFARAYLVGHGIEDSVALGDYVNQDFVDRGRALPLATRSDMVLYNPAKSRRATERVLALLPKARAVPRPASDDRCLPSRGPVDGCGQG